MTQLAVAMALYLALIAGLALHGLDMPDPTRTSSVGNQITDLSEAQLTGATENSLAAIARLGRRIASRKNKHHEPASRKARRRAHQRRSAARLIALVFGALSVAAISGCTPEAAGQTPPPPPDVGVAKVVSRPVREWDEFTGRITAVESVELRARVSGYVERVAYEEGQEINKGDLLFVIDERRYRNQLDSALAELERARSAAELAQVQDTRAQTLLASNAVSRDQADTRKASVTQSNAVVNAARGGRRRGQAQSRIHRRCARRFRAAPAARW